MQAFWASPSLEAFVSLADYVPAHLSPEQLQRVEQTGELVRPAYAPFEAVKKRLAAGIVVRGPVSSRTVWASGLPDPLQTNIKRAQLPSIRASFFGSDEPFVVPLRPFTLAEQFVSFVDALSAFHKVELRMKVLGPAKMGPHGELGVYDVGSIGITFAQPVRVNGIASNGAPTGADITSLRADFTTRCGEPGLNTINSKGINAGWRGAIVAWVGKAPEGIASMGTRQINGKDAYEKLVIDSVDIDRDGVPDLSIWSGLEPELASRETFWEAVFANIGGKWVLIAFAQQADCT
jgi:hypothetical protein